jgi:hypothetical protein
LTSIDRFQVPMESSTRTDIGADEPAELVGVGFQPLTRQVHSNRTLTLPPPGPPWLDGFTGIMFLTSPGRGLAIDYWQTDAEPQGEFFPDCSPTASPTRTPRSLRWNGSSYECYEVLFGPTLRRDAVTAIKPSLLPNESLAWQWQSSVLDPLFGHIHPPGFVADILLRNERDGISVAIEPIKNHLTDTFSADADGLYLTMVQMTNPFLCIRYGYTSTGRNGQSLLLRNSQ